MVRKIRATLEESLLTKVKQSFPEVKGLNPTAVVDWALRKLITEAN